MSIFVWIETFEGTANSASWEAVGVANTLADAMGSDVTALVFGENASAVGAEAGQYGAAKAIVCEDATLSAFVLEPYAALLTQIVQDNSPSVVVAVGTNLGRELLASSAADTNSGLLTEAIELSVDGDTVKAVRPAYAGKVLMEVATSTATKFITIRGRAFPAPSPDESASADVSTVDAVLSADNITTQVEGFESEVGQANLADAAIIVSGGRGMANNPVDAPADQSGDDATIWKAKHGYENTIQPLADVLGAAVGASRASVDAGYIPYNHQVGQTGKVVNPDLYIACGISGAIQHQAGMRGSKIIVAINKDAEAPIFKLARYGIVGDLYDVVPALTEALKKKLS